MMMKRPRFRSAGPIPPELTVRRLRASPRRGIEAERATLTARSLPAPCHSTNPVEADFAWATAWLIEIAERHAKSRIVSVLEGGYHLEGLARSAAEHVAALMGA